MVGDYREPTMTLAPYFEPKFAELIGLRSNQFKVQRLWSCFASVETSTGTLNVAGSERSTTQTPPPYLSGHLPR